MFREMCLRQDGSAKGSRQPQVDPHCFRSRYYKTSISPRQNLRDQNGPRKVWAKIEVYPDFENETRGVDSWTFKIRIKIQQQIQRIQWVNEPNTTRWHVQQIVQQQNTVFQSPSLGNHFGIFWKRNLGLETWRKDAVPRPRRCFRIKPKRSTVRLKRTWLLAMTCCIHKERTGFATFSA